MQGRLQSLEAIINLKLVSIFTQTLISPDIDMYMCWDGEPWRVLVHEMFSTATDSCKAFWPGQSCCSGCIFVVYTLSFACLQSKKRTSTAFSKLVALSYSGALHMLDAGHDGICGLTRLASGWCDTETLNSSQLLLLLYGIRSAKAVYNNTFQFNHAFARHSQIYPDFKKQEVAWIETGETGGTVNYAIERKAILITKTCKVLRRSRRLFDSLSSFSIHFLLCTSLSKLLYSYMYMGQRHILPLPLDFLSRSVRHLEIKSARLLLLFQIGSV